MQGKLSQLFDYQRVAQNSRLAGIIEETESRYGLGLGAYALNDDDLENVNAASAVEINMKDKQNKDKEQERSVKNLFGKKS